MAPPGRVKYRERTTAMNDLEKQVWELQGKVEMLSLVCAALIESHPMQDQIRAIIQARQVYDAADPSDPEEWALIKSGTRLEADLLGVSLKSLPALQHLFRGAGSGGDPG